MFLLPVTLYISHKSNIDLPDEFVNEAAECGLRVELVRSRFAADDSSQLTTTADREHFSRQHISRTRYKTFPDQRAYKEHKQPQLFRLGLHCSSVNRKWLSQAVDTTEVGCNDYVTFDSTAFPIDKAQTQQTTPVLQAPRFLGSSKLGPETMVVLFPMFA